MNVLLVERRGMESMRTNLVKAHSDTQRIFRDAGVVDVFPVPSAQQGPRPYFVPIRDIEQGIRRVVQDAGVDVRYRSTLDSIVHTGDRVTARVVHDGLHPYAEQVEAAVLIDATAGRVASQIEPRLTMQSHPGSGYAIGVHWLEGIPTAGSVTSNAESLEAPGLRLDVAVKALGGTFTGHHDALRGTFGVLELDTQPTAVEHRALVEELGARLGLTTAPDSSYDFPIANRAASAVHAGRLAIVGDSVTRLRPRTGVGLNLGALDARDAAALIEHLHAIDTTPGSVPRSMRVGHAFERFATGARTSGSSSSGEGVLTRHRHALHAELRPSPFQERRAR